jgi:hypothetical protein
MIFFAHENATIKMSLDMSLKMAMKPAREARKFIN